MTRMTQMGASNDLSCAHSRHSRHWRQSSSRRSEREMPNAPWVIVAAGVHRLGGGDKANFALVEYLLQRDVPVHVVTHEIDPGLMRHPAIRVDLVPLPAGSRFIAEKLLS